MCMNPTPYFSSTIMSMDWTLHHIIRNHIQEVFFSFCLFEKKILKKVLESMGDGLTSNHDEFGKVEVGMRLILWWVLHDDEI